MAVLRSDRVAECRQEGSDAAQDHQYRQSHHRARRVLAGANASTGAGSIRASHGCFDNAVDIVGDALGYCVNPKQTTRIKFHWLDY